MCKDRFLRGLKTSTLTLQAVHHAHCVSISLKLKRHPRPCCSYIHLDSVQYCVRIGLYAPCCAQIAVFGSARLTGSGLYGASYAESDVSTSLIMIGTSVLAPPGKLSGSQQQTRGALPSSPPADPHTAGSSPFEDMPSEPSRLRRTSTAKDACRASTIMEEGPQDLAGAASSSLVQGKLTHCMLM